VPHSQQVEAATRCIGEVWCVGPMVVGVAAAWQSGRTMMRGCGLAPAMLLCALLGRGAAADQLSLATESPERDRFVIATYRLDRPTTAAGMLQIEWTDAHGRLIEAQSIDVALKDGDRVEFALDMRRAVAMRNRLDATLSLREAPAAASVSRATVSLPFIARPPSDPWLDFQIIM
jgi:hypothetical protein